MPGFKTEINQKTLEEVTSGMLPYFSYRSKTIDYHEKPGNQFPWHWHSDVEFFYIAKGRMEYHIPGNTIQFNELDAGFINANVLHMTTSMKNDAAIQQEHIFGGSLIGGGPGSVFEALYVRELLNNRQVPVLHFPSNSEQTATMRELMDQAHYLYETQEYGFEFRIRAIMSELWLLVLSTTTKPQAPGRYLDKLRVKQMLLYIAENFNRHVSLQDIADAAHISKRECCRCFQRQLQVTPVSYLNAFRLEKACQILSGSVSSISEITERCGFSNVSYFSKYFKQQMGCTPTQFRNSMPT